MAADPPQPSTGELAFYRCYAPGPVPLAALVRVAGTRRAIEETFQAGKSQTGLDHYQVRRWNSWHRWTVLAMLAHAFLAVLAAAAATGPPDPGRYAHQPEPIDLTVAEIRTCRHPDHPTRPRTWPTSCANPPGDDAAKAKPDTPTTDAEPSNA